MTHADRNHSGRNLAKEVSVMRDRNDAALKVGTGILQHLLAGDVQVVGGLIQDQERALQARHNCCLLIAA